MLQKWLKQDISPTWNTLELAIINAQRDDLSLDNLSRSMPVFMMHCVIHVPSILVCYVYEL